MYHFRIIKDHLKTNKHKKYFDNRKVSVETKNGCANIFQERVDNIIRCAKNIPLEDIKYQKYAVCDAAQADIPISSHEALGETEYVQGYLGNHASIGNVSHLYDDFFHLSILRI